MHGKTIISTPKLCDSQKKKKFPGACIRAFVGILEGDKGYVINLEGNDEIYDLMKAGEREKGYFWGGIWG